MVVYFDKYRDPSCQDDATILLLILSDLRMLLASCSCRSTDTREAELGCT